FFGFGSGSGRRGVGSDGGGDGIALLFHAVVVVAVETGGLTGPVGVPPDPVPPAPHRQGGQQRRQEDHGAGEHDGTAGVVADLDHGVLLDTVEDDGGAVVEFHGVADADDLDLVVEQ